MEETLLSQLTKIVEKYGKYNPQQHLTKEEVGKEFSINPNSLDNTLSKWKNPKHFNPALPYISGCSEHLYVWKDLVEFRDKHLRKRKMPAIEKPCVSIRKN